MLHGGDIRPYREPAPGGAGGDPCVKFTNARGDEFVDRYLNNTTIAQPVSDGVHDPYTVGWTPTVNDVFPFELYDQTVTPQCNDFPTANPAGMPNNWIGVARGQYSIVSGQVNEAPVQTWAHTPGDKVNFAICFKNGFKNVAAVLQWNGIFPWTSHDGVPCADIICDDHSYESYQPTPSNVKYLILTTDITLDISRDEGTDTPGVFINRTRNATASGSMSVNVNSGEKTSDVITEQTDANDVFPTPLFYSNGGAGYIVDGDGMTVNYPKGLSTVLDDLCSRDMHCYGIPLPNFDSLPPLDAAVIENIPAKWNITPGPSLTDVTDVDNYSDSASRIFSGISGTTETITVSWSRSGTVYEWSVSYTIEFPDPPSGPAVLSYEFSGSLTLSGENTNDDVYEDAKGLLSFIQMDNDRNYPWRTDGKPQVAPLMSRLQIPFNVTAFGFNTYTVDDLSSPIDDVDGNPPFDPSWSPTYSQIDWFDPAVYSWKFPDGMDYTNSAATALVKMFNGSLQGELKPAGYVNYFRFDFIDWKSCCFDDTLGTRLISVFINGYGMSLQNFIAETGAQLPLNATQWTNNYDVINKPTGASLIYADSSIPPSPHSGATICPFNGISGRPGALWAYKYAEIANRYQSQNFFRPAGADKFSYDETKVYCYDGATLADQSGTTITDALAGTWGGKSVDGFYTGCSAVAGVLTIGTKVFDVPSNWVSRSEDDDFCFGQLRFPACPSLLGRVWVRAVADSLTVAQGAPGRIPTNQFAAAAQPQFGMATATHQESLDIYDGAGALLASSITATRTADNTFTLAAAYAGIYWVMIHGAPAYYFDDNFPKGDFLTLEFLLDKRTNGERARIYGNTDCDGDPLVSPELPDANNGFATFSQTQGSLPFIPCCPAVICFSPNGEVFENGLTIPFPPSFAMDERYGSGWQGYVQVSMTDLLWQAPHHPCAATDDLSELDFDGDHINFQADVGTCKEPSVDEDTGILTIYYPLAPLVEARATLPGNYGALQNETAPALPAGIQVGWLSPVDHTGDGVAPLPPPIGMDESLLPKAIDTPWALHARLCAAIANASICNFKADYLDFTVGCQKEEE